MNRNFLLITFVIVSLIVAQGCADKKPETIKKNVQYVSGADEVTYLKLGKEITDTVGKTLKANMMEAMNNGGPAHAVSFCNSKAMELTTVYSEKYNTEVKRVTDRNRNANNAANKVELAVLEDFNNMLKAGQTVSPRVAIDAEGRKNYYAPIYTGGVCLACHGNPKNMQPEVLVVIDSLYPGDKAKNYTVDELRGIWSVKFKNS